jgi:hypothetical protein
MSLIVVPTRALHLPGIHMSLKRIESMLGIDIVEVIARRATRADVQHLKDRIRPQRPSDARSDRFT